MSRKCKLCDGEYNDLGLKIKRNSETLQICEECVKAIHHAFFEKEQAERDFVSWMDANGPGR